MIGTILLLALLAIAAATDVAWQRIYNWTTYSGILLAWGLNAAGEVAVLAGKADPERLEALGWIGFAASLAGFLLCGFVLLACYVFFQVGGGDVKLMAMVGAIAGPEGGIEIMLWTFVIGGCMALIVLVWRVGAVRLVARAARHALWTLRLGRFVPLSAEDRAELQPALHLAPSALAAAAIVQFAIVERL
ncbi:MAG: prepilin peptidase [Rhodopirellula sp.]|nr:prepilin peptidase [Rhodopirellula sp.]